MLEHQKVYQGKGKEKNNNQIRYELFEEGKIVKSDRVAQNLNWLDIKIRSNYIEYILICIEN